MNPDNYAVIMAGGIGSRFWPMSTIRTPKQFIDILGLGQSLIQQTYERLSRVVPMENIHIATNQIYLDTIRQLFPDISSDRILCEPVIRNTAPSIAYACYKIRKENPRARIVVTPSDHYIGGEEAFSADLDRVLEACADYPTSLFTLGIQPTRPDTGYGYIQYQDEYLCAGSPIRRVKTFTEKPDLELALAFLRSGDFLWNSGIFVWSAAAVIRAFEKWAPEIHEMFSEGELYYFTDAEKDYIDRIYPACPKTSIDFAVMEKADNVFVLPASFGWSDLGTWRSIYDRVPLDKDENALVSGNIQVYDSRGNVLKTSPGKTMIVKGLNNFIVVDANDVVLICPKDQEQSIKHIVEDLKSKGKDIRF